MLRKEQVRYKGGSPIRATIPYILFPDGRELQAYAWLSHNCLPYPHVEQTDCGVRTTERGVETWLIPQEARDPAVLAEKLNKDGVAYYSSGPVFGDVLEVRERDESKEPNLCQFTPFYWAEKWFGHETAQRLYEKAYRFQCGEPQRRGAGVEL